MGTREVYEEKLRTGNLHHDPTINPGLGSPRCPRRLSLLNPNSEKGEWTITSVLHDATAVAGCGLGGMLSAFYGLNTGMPYVQKHVKGPKWLPFVVGIPPLLKCCIWRVYEFNTTWLWASKVYSANCDIILCCLKCFALWYFTAYQIH